MNLWWFIIQRLWTKIASSSHVHHINFLQPVFTLITGVTFLLRWLHHFKREVHHTTKIMMPTQQENKWSNQVFRFLMGRFHKRDQLQRELANISFVDTIFTKKNTAFGWDQYFITAVERDLNWKVALSLFTKALIYWDHR